MENLFYPIFAHNLGPYNTAPPTTHPQTDAQALCLMSTYHLLAIHPDAQSSTWRPPEH